MVLANNYSHYSWVDIRIQVRVISEIRTSQFTESTCALHEEIGKTIPVRVHGYP